MPAAIVSSLASPFGINEALRVSAYDKSGGEKLADFPVMFNPESVSLSYSKSASGIGRLCVSSELEMKLIFSRTGVEPLTGGKAASLMNLIPAAGAVFSLGLPGVAGDVNLFLKMTMQIQSETHKPPWLKLSFGTTLAKLSKKKLKNWKFWNRVGSAAWGAGKAYSPDYEGQMKSVDVAYTLFDRMGNPLRAELNCVFSGAGDVPELQSPDVTHARTVETGDSLPLMSSRVYDDSSYYMKVAEANNLDSVRNIPAGGSISFPPVK